MSKIKSYKDLLEEFVPHHPNKNKLLDALETREISLQYEEENKEKPEIYPDELNNKHDNLA